MPYNWWWNRLASKDVAATSAVQGVGASGPPAGTPPGSFGPTPPGSFGDYGPTPCGPFGGAYGPTPGLAGSPLAQDAGAVGLPLGTMPPDGCPATAEEKAAQEFVCAASLGPPPTGSFGQSPPGPYFGPPLGSFDSSGLPLGTLPPDGCPATAHERAALNFVGYQQAAASQASWAAAATRDRRSADCSARTPGLGPQKVDMESPPASFGFEDGAGPTAIPEDTAKALDEPMKVTVKNLSIHVEEPGPPPGLHPGPPTMSFPVDLERSTLFPSDLEKEKRHLHDIRECQPCAYFHQKQDKCRKGFECDFCHFCEKGELKKRKRQKAKELKAGSRPAEKAAGAAEEAGDG